MSRRRALTRRAFVAGAVVAPGAMAMSCDPRHLQEAPMITLRPAADRFRTRIGWLDSQHTFSFGAHHDAAHMGFGVLRVINEDRVTAGAGFGTHPHKDMEIISYVIDGALSHQDSMGNGSTIVPGDVQRMSAGSGVTHSEKNPARDQPVHFLQIWLLPKSRGITPGYAQQRFSVDDKRDRLRLVASDTPTDGAVSLHSDVDLYASHLSADKAVELPLRRGGRGWVQIISGSVELSDGNGPVQLAAGDGAAITGKRVSIKGVSPETELLVFDLGA